MKNDNCLLKNVQVMKIVIIFSVIDGRYWTICTALIYFCNEKVYIILLFRIDT